MAREFQETSGGLQLIACEYGNRVESTDQPSLPPSIMLTWEGGVAEVEAFLNNPAILNERAVHHDLSQNLGPEWGHAVLLAQYDNNSAQFNQVWGATRDLLVAKDILDEETAHQLLSPTERPRPYDSELVQRVNQALLTVYAAIAEPTVAPETLISLAKEWAIIIGSEEQVELQGRWNIRTRSDEPAVIFMLAAKGLYDRSTGQFILTDVQPPHKSLVSPHLLPEGTDPDPALELMEGALRRHSNYHPAVDDGLNALRNR